MKHFALEIELSSRKLLRTHQQHLNNGGAHETVFVSRLKEKGVLLLGAHPNVQRTFPRYIDFDDKRMFSSPFSEFTKLLDGEGYHARALRSM